MSQDRLASAGAVAGDCGRQQAHRDRRSSAKTDAFSGRSLIAVPGSESGRHALGEDSFRDPGAGENGISCRSARKNGRGRIQSLITVPVLLLSAGESQVNPPGNTIYERVAFADLPPEAEITGGVLHVTGQVLPYNSSP